MELQGGSGDIRDLLVNSCFVLPLAFAVWKFDDDEVFLSNKLKLMISAKQNCLEPYDFVKAMHHSFGSFLNTAVEKVDKAAARQSARNDYASPINILGEEFTLKLSFYAEKQLYVFTADNSKKPAVQNAKTNDAESELKTLLDALPVFIWQKDRNLKITYCNEAYAKALESSKDAVVRDNLKLIPSSKREGYSYQGVYASKARKFTEHVILGGARRLLSIEESAFSANGRSTGFAVDVTDREELESSFSEYKKQTEAVLNELSVPLAVFDKNSFLLLANDAVVKLFNAENFDISEKRTFADIMDYLISNKSMIMTSDIAHYKARALELFQNAIEPHRTMLYLKNGRSISVTLSPIRAGGIVFMFEDVTDKVSLERELKSITSVRLDMLNHLSEGVIVFGTDNRIKAVNNAANAIWNNEKVTNEMHISSFFAAQTVADKETTYTDDEGAASTTPENADAFVVPAAADKVKSWVSRLTDMAAQRREFSNTIALPSGISVECKYAPLPDGLNLLRFRDLSECETLKNELAEKNSVVEQIGKLKSSLISNISSELRAPLQAISGFMDVLKNQYFGELNEKQRGYCTEISKSIDVATETVDAITELANIKAGLLDVQHKDVNLLKLINTALSRLAKVAEVRNVSLSTDFSDTERFIFGNPKLLQQMLYHLVARALWNIHSSGCITVSAKIFPDDPYCQLTVRDDSPALDDEDVKRLRKMLASDSDGYEIIDLRLELANRIAKAHNGKVLVDNPIGGGNAISCKIPVRIAF